MTLDAMSLTELYAELEVRALTGQDCTEILQAIIDKTVGENKCLKM